MSNMYWEDLSSLMVQSFCPTDCGQWQDMTHVAGLLSADPVICVATMRLMKQDWKILGLAEQSSKLKCLLLDLQFLFSMPARLACSLFEASGWISSDATALGILSAVVKTLPDSKIVEDAHLSVRVEAKANANQKLKIGTVQSSVMCHELSHLQQPQFVSPSQA